MEAMESEMERDNQWDIRFLALETLRKASNGDEFIHYRDARLVLGRQLHMRKRKTRQLLLETARIGLVRFDIKGRIFFMKKEKGEYCGSGVCPCKQDK